MFEMTRKFMNTAKVFEEMKKEIESPEVQEKIRRDAELAFGTTKIPPTIMTATKVAAFSALVPNLAYIPPGMASVEAGAARVRDFGVHRIPFESAFSDTPHALTAMFGFFELSLPLPRIEWRTFGPSWLEIRIPVPVIEWKTIRLPSLTFPMDVKKDYIEVFHVAGETLISYFAIGE